MKTFYRLVQVIVVLLIIPMVALGGMAMFSGGGMTPELQDIALQLMFQSIYIPIFALILSEIIYQLMKRTRLRTIMPIPILIAALPLVMWGWRIFQLSTLS